MDYKETEVLIEKTVKKTVDYLKIENQLHCAKQMADCQENNIEPLKNDINEIKNKVDKIGWKMGIITSVVCGLFYKFAPILIEKLGG